MQNKTRRLILASVCACLITSTAFAARQQNAKAVNIDLNPDAAQTVPLTHHDQHLIELREQANQAAATSAKAEGESYVSRAPDPNNPNYWKTKNSNSDEASQSDSSSNGDGEKNKLARQQQLQRETTALRKVLSTLNHNQQLAAKVNSVEFKLPKQTSSSSKSHTHNTTTKAIALPGTVWYATMISAADSYVPGPVMVEIEEGPFACGRAIGKFEVAPDGEHLILSFNLVSLHGHSYPVSAVAMDPDTKISGVTGDIDHHIFTRFIIPGAASFLEQVTQALMSQGQSIVSNPSGVVVTTPKLSKTQLELMGASGAAKSLADATKPKGVLRFPEVKIQSGQGIGFLVLKSISQKRI